MSEVSEDLQKLSALGALRELTSRRTSVRAYIEACLERIAQRDAEVQAWVNIQPEKSLVAATLLDQLGPEHRPLFGLPIGIKDVIYTRDWPTQHNSPLYLDSHPVLDASCVAILREAGAVILGKTATVEFAATGHAPPTRNPRDLSRTPGGSSSGSAAAVADYQVPISIGTQTGGSIIRPASFCGIYAIKPTWGLVSREGAKTYAPSLDTIGWFARTAEDLMLVFDVLAAEAAPWPLFTLDSARIGICRTPWWNLSDDSSQIVLAKVESLLADSGAYVEPLELPDHFERLLGWQNTVMRKEAQSSFAADYRRAPALLHKDIRDQASRGAGFSHEQLLEAYDGAAKYRSEFDDIASEFDAIITLSTCGEAPLAESGTGDLTFNAAWSLLHVPCVNVPGMTGFNGLPVGISVIGPRFHDRQVLVAAQSVGRLFRDD